MKNELVFNKYRILGYLPIKQIITSALISGILLTGLYIAESLYPKNSITAIVSMDNALSEQLKLISFLSRHDKITLTNGLTIDHTSCGKIYSNETDPVSIKLIPFSSNGVISVESRHKDLAFNKLRDFYNCSASLLKNSANSYEKTLIEYIDNTPGWMEVIFKEKTLMESRKSFEEIEQLKAKKAFINQHLVIKSEIIHRDFRYYGSIYLSIFGVMILVLLLFGKWL